jgi:hypothetical protein
MSTTKTLHGPGGLRLKLDREEVIVDDPGAGTPAMVQLFQYTATYWCALGEGELEDSLGRTRQLTGRQQRWLEDQQAEVDRFLDLSYHGISPATGVDPDDILGHTQQSRRA